MNKEEIIKEINNIIEEYGSFNSCDIDKYLIVDELLYSTCYVLSNTFYVDKVYCELLIGDNGDPEDYIYYYYKDLEDIEVLKEILKFCNIYKQQCTEEQND